MTDLPLACTLPADAMRDRAASIGRLAEEALIGQEEIAGGVRSRFRGAADVEQRLRELVAAEAECCAFLAFAMRREGDELWLDVTGAPEARPVIRQFFAQGAGR